MTAHVLQLHLAERISPSPGFLRSEPEVVRWPGWVRVLVILGLPLVFWSPACWAGAVFLRGGW